jgi:hypothetical protein
MRLPVVLAACLAGGPASAQEAEPAPFAGPSFRLGGEFKVAYRDSRDLTSPVFFPFGPPLVPTTRLPVVMRTVDPGRSLELVNLALRGEGELASGVSAKVEVHFLDLYNRNPTSSDDRILVREAWVRFGEAPEPLQGKPATRAFLLVGLAPRFSKQVVRRLESYGMWGTAVARFEQPQVQAGLLLGGNVYLRAMVGSGNPVFFRDTNALAGDNGTPERAPGNVDPIYESGFPVLYDAKPADLNVNGEFEWGAGLGLRFGDRDGAALDLLGWRFQRELADAARIRGTFYEGDLDLLRGAGFPLPFSGRKKSEWGVNVQARAGGFRLFGQWVDQEIAELPRRGLEAELAFFHRLGGAFLVRQSPVLNWIQPVFRFSWTDNLFEGPREYPALSVLWDWRKYDFGVRFGLVADVDLTVEYSRHDMVRRFDVLHPDEFLAVLRVGF